LSLPRVSGCCSICCSRVCSIALICSLMIFNRSMSRRRAAIVLGGKDLPSGVRTVSSFTVALRSLGLKLRTPNWIKADFMRLTTRVCSWTNPSRSRCGRLASSSSMVGTIAPVQWPRSPRSQPRKPRFNIAVSSRSVLARRCSRDTATLVAWMTCASMPRSGCAGDWNDMCIYAAYPQPARQPETVPAGLEGNCNALDLAPCFLCFDTPAIEQIQQCALVDRELLQRLALDARYDAGNEPARLAHLDHGDQRAVRIEGSEGSAQVVQLLHGVLHRFTSATMDAISASPPHSIFLRDKLGGCPDTDRAASGVWAARSSIRLWYGT